MRAYFDTSVLVAGLLDFHPDHGRATAWFERVFRREVRGVTSTHGLAETWSALTGLPTHPPLTSATAHRLVREGILARFEVTSATRRDYERVLAAAAQFNTRGGSVYDALHAAMARKSRADVVLTFDIRDFRRVAPDLAARVRTP